MFNSSFSLAHLQLLDSALPIGAFSHSFGLETLVQEGRIRTASHLHEYSCAMMFGSWAPSDSMAIKAVYDWGRQDKWDDVWLLDSMLHAARASRESRDGWRKMGRRLMKLGQAMHPELPWQSLNQAVESGRCIGVHPTIYGWLCYHLNVPLTQAVEGYLYSCCVATINNAVRLMPLGQTAAQTLVAQLLPSIAQAWEEVSSRDPFDFSTSNLHSEIAAMRHETLYSRLFMS